MGGCQNYGPLLGPLDTRCGIILRTQKGTISLTTTHMVSVWRGRVLRKELDWGGGDPMIQDLRGSNK